MMLHHLVTTTPANDILSEGFLKICDAQLTIRKTDESSFYCFWVYFLFQICYYGFHTVESTALVAKDN